MDTKTIIKKLGGGVKTAALCQVSPAAVSQWIENGIPPARLMFLKLARPDVFTENDDLKRQTTDKLIDRGHGGRQPASPHNILDTVPDGAVIVPSGDQKN